MASFWELNRRRKAVLAQSAEAHLVARQSAQLQRAVQQRAIDAKTEAKFPRGSTGIHTPEEVRLIVALDAVNAARNALNVSTNELDSVLGKTEPFMRSIGS